MPVEIERNWAVREMGTEAIFREAKKVAINQAYIFMSDSGDAEARIRMQVASKDDVKYTLTVKHGTGMVRDEVEILITKAQFHELFKNHVCDLAKVRFFIKYEGYTVELDTYSGFLTGLLVAEVEFHSEKEAEAFEPPDWFEKDVTDDPQYRDSWLAKNGYPDYRP